MALSDTAIRKAKPADTPLKLRDGGGLRGRPAASQLAVLKSGYPDHDQVRKPQRHE